MPKDYKIIISIIIIASIVLLGFDAQQNITAGVVKDTDLDTVITISQGSFDIGSKDQGTITIGMNPQHYRELITKNSNKNVKYLIFFSSKILPGLEIRYNLEEQIFEAGIPPFKSLKVDLLNGNYHQLAYSYQLGDKQTIYFDGHPIGERPYLHQNNNLISGFAVKIPTRYNTIIDESLVSKVMIADYAMTSEEVRQRNS